MASKLPTWELLKSVGGVATDAMMGSFPAAGLLKQGAGAIAEYYRAQTERRYEEFVRAALEGDVFPENAEDMSAEDLMGMLRLCMADIEQQKAPLYGRLAKAIAQKKVPAEFRHPLMMALSAITLRQAERMKHAWVAERHELVPARGIGKKPCSEFLGSKGGVLDRRDFAGLAAQSLAEDEQLTSLGRHLVEACFPISEVTPEAIGEKVWRPGVLPIISYDLDRSEVVNFAGTLADMARSHSVKTTAIVAPRDARQSQAMWMRAQGSFVVIIGQNPSRLLAHIDVFERAIEKSFRPIVVFLNERAEEALDRFHEPAVVDAHKESRPLASIVIEHVFQANGG